MKRYLIISGLFCLVLVVVACAPTNVEPVTETSIPTQQPDATDPPVVTKPPVTPTTELIPVTGPSMEVGSVHPYVDGSNLLAVPAGEFVMGDSETGNLEHRVTLNDFWIYSTKVTNQQYALCVGLGQCTLPDLDVNPAYSDIVHANNPVVGVTYDQASAYCKSVNGRLPTEAEWEKAARGPQGNIYPWGDVTPSCDLLNFNDCTGEKTNVVNYPDGKSFYGSLEMAGNAFEWVADWYDVDYYLNAPDENPSGPETGEIRSIRSSSFESGPDQIPVVNRYFDDPQSQRHDLGFRCVIEEPTYFAPFCEYPLLYESQASVSAEACPALEITQAQYCSNKIPTTNVTFTGPASSVIDAGDCLPSGDPALFVCQTADQVSITADCQLDLPENSACPTGYSQQGDICVPDGSRGQCLDGWSFDSASQCCTAQPGQGSSLNIAACPVGTYYSGSENACLPFPAQGIVSVVQDVVFVGCSAFGSSGGDGGDDGGGNGGGNGSGGGDDGGGDPCPGGTWDPNLQCCSTDPFCY